MSLKSWVFPLACAVIPLFINGCSKGDFSDSTVGYLIESVQHQLDGEQVMLNRGEVDCGAQSDLWEIATVGGDRTVGRLTDRARSLGFSDDIQISDPAFPNPYAQVRGSFSLVSLQVGNTRDEGPQTKFVDAKVGVKINHSCFANPVPVLMGVRHGQFTMQNAMLKFQLIDANWQLAEFVH